MIQWTKASHELPKPLEKFQSYSFLGERWEFRPLLFIGLINVHNGSKYKTFFGRYNHEAKMWVNSEGAQVYGVTYWSEYNEPEDL